MGAADLLDRDIGSASFVAGVDQRFWRLERRDGLTLYVTLLAFDGTEYLLRLDCRDYGEEAIEGLFVDSETNTCVDKAWPRGNGTFSQWIKFTGSDLFVCWDQDRGGIRRHAEWRPLKKWTRTPNQLVAYLTFLSRLVQLPAYGHTARKQAA
jgi:hypothetical protein